MHVKIQTTEKGSNKGSCSEYANYLEKENEHKPEHEKECFFTHENQQIQTLEVINAIDSNNKKLGKEEAKFFSVTLSPSEAELKHIGKDNDKLKEFTRAAMDGYAKNFNKGLEGKDLLYFAKIEQERKYKGKDIDVKIGQAKQGELKHGDNRHIHVIVSRRAKDNGYKISPLANEKNSKGMLNGKEVQKGFDRQKYYDTVEKIFDLKTDYKRTLEETYQYKLEQCKLTTEEKITEALNPKQIKNSTLEQERPGSKIDQDKERKNQQGFSFEL